MSARANDWQAWQWVNFELFEEEDWRFYLYSDNRVGSDVVDGTDCYIQVISPRFKWHAGENLDFGLGYARLEIDPLSGGPDFWQHRTEFEFNPKFRSGSWAFHSRNRVEQRWVNGQGKPLLRIRNRLQAKYSFGEGGLLHYYTNNEFFFDLEREIFSENRCVPIGLGFRLSDRATLNLFYMIQSLERPGGWEHFHIAGTFLQLDL